jgi:hypothetical protein
MVGGGNRLFWGSTNNSGVGAPFATFTLKTPAKPRSAVAIMSAEITFAIVLFILFSLLLFFRYYCHAFGI